MRAEVVLAHAASYLSALGQAGLLQPYAPKGLDRVNGRFLDRGQPPLWVGLYAWASAVCVNREQWRKSGAPLPTKWADLLNPALKGHLTMPSPTTFDTGWGMQAAAIVKGTRNLKDAQTLLDWALGNPAMEAFARFGELISVKVRVQKLEHLPPNIPEKMVKHDFGWLAREQPRLIAEWTRRYGAKAEPEAK